MDDQMLRPVALRKQDRLIDLIQAETADGIARSSPATPRSVERHLPPTRVASSSLDTAAAILRQLALACCG
jgi:hypothetical protein